MHISQAFFNFLSRVDGQPFYGQQLQQARAVLMTIPSGCQEDRLHWSSRPKLQAAARRVRVSITPCSQLDSQKLWPMPMTASLLSMTQLDELGEYSMLFVVPRGV